MFINFIQLVEFLLLSKIINSKKINKLLLGDCYVVLGILDKIGRDEYEEANNVVSMAFSMIEIIR